MFRGWVFPCGGGVSGSWVLVGVGFLGRGSLWGWGFWAMGPCGGGVSGPWGPGGVVLNHSISCPKQLSLKITFIV